MPKNVFVIQDTTEMNVRATAFQAQCLMRNLKTQTLIERAEMLHNDAGQMAKNDLVAQGTADMTVHPAALRAQQTMQNLTAQTPILELAPMLQIYACRIAKKDLVAQDKAGMTLRTTALQAQQGCRISRREGHTRNNQDVARICWPDGPKRPCCPRHPRHEWRCDIA